jgi:hypothetical protein
MKRNTVRLKKSILGCITLALLLSVSMAGLAAKIKIVRITNKNITAEVTLTANEVKAVGGGATEKNLLFGSVESA